MKMKTLISIGSFAVGSIATAGLLIPSAASAVTLTYEAPNTFSASASVGTTKQVDFESLSIGANNGYNTSFVDAVSTNTYKATYDQLQVANYGAGSQTAGAGYTGKFAVNNPTLATTNLTFTDTTAGGTIAGVKYFGMFYSSLDSGNQLTFYNGATVLSQFTISNIPKLLNNNTTFKGGPYDQYGAFLNFYAGAGEQFTKIQFTQTDLSGFENDNHTFRIPNALAISGTGVDLSALSVSQGSVNTTAVPEPLDLVGTLFGGMAAIWLKQKLHKTRSAKG
jgi:hypothetical protein